MNEGSFKRESVPYILIP